MACGILALGPGIQPLPAALEGEIITTGLPVKYLKIWFYDFFSKGDYSLIKILKEEGENLGFTEAGKVNKSHKEGLTVSLTGLEKTVEAFLFLEYEWADWSFYFVIP